MISALSRISRHSARTFAAHSRGRRAASLSGSRAPLDSSVRRHLLACALTLAAAALEASPVGTATPVPAFTALQKQRLAEEIVTHTPEKLHWGKTPVLAWVVIEDENDGGLDGLREMVVGLLKRRYIVLASRSEIEPRDRLGPPDWPEFENGFILSYKVNVLDSRVLEVSYSDYENPLAGSFQKVRYKWRKNRWRRLWASVLQVASVLSLPMPPNQSSKRTRVRNFVG